MMRILTNERTVAGTVLALLLAGLLVDLTTPQDFVVAILYAIPIALTGVSGSRRLTWWAVVLSLLASLGAGWDNAVSQPGPTDMVAVANRGLAAMSTLLVAGLTLLFEASHNQVEELRVVERDVQQADELRELVIELVGPLGHDALVATAARELRRTMRADSVIVSVVDADHQFVAPQWRAPRTSQVAKPGTLASWAVDALPGTRRPVIGVRSDEGLTIVGRWRATDHQDLIVLVARPSIERGAQFLGDALLILSPLRERALHLDGVLAGDQTAVAACVTDEDDLEGVEKEAAASG